MFLYPALLAGFLFVAVPPLVHLINMLRHRRRRWAAMDFLLVSFRKRQKWLRLRQFLLLLARIAVAALLVALMSGWTGGRQLLGALGGQSIHHIVILDDSYSMGERSGGGGTTAYGRALQSLEQLVRRLASSDGNHQLTVMRASRATLAARGGSESGDAAADLSAQTVTSDAGLIARVMATDVSPLRTDLIAALDLAAELADSTPSDELNVYVASDFRQRDWASAERLSESMRRFPSENRSVRMIDCASRSLENLAVTDLIPDQDVWVAGVPVVVRATVRNYGMTTAKNISLSCRVIRYGASAVTADPTRRFSGVVESQPGIVIEELAAGSEITKSFQVFINEKGTHAIEVELPKDSLDIDNRRVCTLPLSDVERVLVIDSDPDQGGAYTIAAVLDPGSQVRIGAVPDVKPPGFLRSITAESLASYRAVYLVDLPEIADSTADLLQNYVNDGGGLAWFLGESVSKDDYNRKLLGQDRQLLPAALDAVTELPIGGTGDVVFGEEVTLIDPLRGAGDASLSRIGVAKSWTLLPTDAETDAERVRFRPVLARRDSLPLITQHTIGAGTVVTFLTSLNTEWTNWPGDPTFVPFMLLTNARLWSGAAATTSRKVDEPLSKSLSLGEYFPEVKWLPAADAPPRVALESIAEAGDGTEAVRITMDPIESLISGNSNVEDLLRPGVSEWQLLRAEGGSEVIPSAAVIENGEGDLRRGDPVEIQRALLPVDVQFVSSDDWSQQNQTAGSSTIGLMLLALLGLVLAAEQALAYWASYHSRADASSMTGPPGSAPVTRPKFGLSTRGGHSG